MGIEAEMGEGPGEQRPHQEPAKPPPGEGLTHPKTLIAGIPLESIDAVGEEQVVRLRQAGAIYPEKIQSPITIRHPDNPNSAAVVLTCRWLGGGLFGGLMVSDNGLVTSVAISIKDAIAANPGLSPRGTIGGTPWKENIISYKADVLPRSETMKEGTLQVAKEVTNELLREFPNKLSFLGADKQSSASAERAQNILKRALGRMIDEIADGMELAPPWDERSRDVRDLFLLGLKNRLGDVLVEESFTNFVRAQVRTALEQYDKLTGKGLIFKLIKDASLASALRTQTTLRQRMKEEPFAKPTVSELTEIGRTGLTAVSEKNRELKILTENLTAEKISQIAGTIGLRAWEHSYSEYLQTN